MNAGAEQSERFVWSWMRQTAAVHGLSTPREKDHFSDSSRQATHSCGASHGPEMYKDCPKDVNTGARRIKTLTQVVDELLRHAFNKSSNEMVCMSIEVGYKKAS